MEEPESQQAEPAERPEKDEPPTAREQSRRVGLALAVAALVAVLAVTLAFAQRTAPTLAAVPVGSAAQGCAVEYWLEHPESWEEYDPDTYLVAAMYGPASEAGEDTFFDALSYEPGDDPDGARRGLLREAVAATLNSAHESVRYPMKRYQTPPQGGFVPVVRAIIESGDSGAMVRATQQLSSLNTLECPLG